MRTLILMRHGQAESRAPSGRDRDRALTQRGRSDAAAAGADLVVTGTTPVMALVSAARRTQETWAAVAGAFPDVPAEVEEALYGAPADALLAAAQACTADTVMLVAHNPGVAELAATLTGRAEPFPPAAYVVVTWEDGGPRRVHSWSPA